MKLLSLYAVLLLLLASSPVSAEPTSVDNGLLALGQGASLAESGLEAAIPIGGLWQEFKFGPDGSLAEACDETCVPSEGGNSEYAPSPPWTFWAPPGGVQLTVTDGWTAGDIFEVFDFGVSLGTTSLVDIGNSCGSDPAVCMLDPQMSSAVFSLEPGDHSITIMAIASPYNVGAAYFRTDGVDPLLQLKLAVLELNLNPGLENGLTAKLDGALSILADDNPNNDHVAINKLQSFINQVNSQRGKEISEADADALVAAAEAIIASFGGIVSVELNDRNANEKGAHGIALIDPVAEEGIIEIVSLEVSNLLPDHDYLVWKIIQDAGEFDPTLDISPNFFRSSVTSNPSGGFSISGGTFPGPAAALKQGRYRVDIFVTHTHETPVLDEYEANLIRATSLYGTQALAGYDLLLSSAPFSTGIEVTVP